MSWGVFKIAWSKNGTPDTLGSANASLTITDLTSTKFNNILHHTLSRSAASTNEIFQVGNGSIDTGSNYAERSSSNGGAEGTSTSAAHIEENISSLSDMFAVIYSINIAAEEKLFIFFHIERNTAGAGTAPIRHERVGKWTNTSNQFDQIKHNTGGADTFNTSSNMSALGTD